MLSQDEWVAAYDRGDTAAIAAHNRAENAAQYAPNLSAITEPFVVEGVVDNNSWGDSDMLVDGVDLDNAFKSLEGVRVRVTIELLSP